MKPSSDVLTCVSASDRPFFSWSQKTDRTVFASQVEVAARIVGERQHAVRHATVKRRGDPSEVARRIAAADAKEGGEHLQLPVGHRNAVLVARGASALFEKPAP